MGFSGGGIKMRIWHDPPPVELHISADIRTLEKLQEFREEFAKVAATFEALLDKQKDAQS